MKINKKSKLPIGASDFKKIIQNDDSYYFDLIQIIQD